MQHSLTMWRAQVVTVTVGVDFDAHSVWMAVYGFSSPSNLSRGDYEDAVAVPRLLEAFEARRIPTTWFIPAHTMETFPERVRQVREAGHEIAAHGCYHEKLGDLTAQEERHLLLAQIAQHERIIGARPRGYRSPSWDFTDATLGLLEECGFEWDSSLMGNDFSLYHPRPVVRLSLEEGNRFGDPSPLIEIPVSWHLDDFPATEFVPGIAQGLTPPSKLWETWSETLAFAVDRVPDPVFNLTVHPQCIGRAHYFRMFERFLDHAAEQRNVRFMTMSQLAAQHRAAIPTEEDL